MSDRPYTRIEAGVLLRIRLTPNASSNRIGSIQVSAQGHARLKVNVTVVPEKGKANKALVKLMAKFLLRPARDLEIVSGHTDRNKNILISGEADDVIWVLNASIAALE